MLRVVLASMLGSSLVSALVTLAVITIATPPSAEAQTRTVVAQEFRLVDASNRERASLGFSTTGSVLFDINDSRGRRWFRAIVEEGGGGAVLLGQNGAAGLALTTLADRAPIISLSDAQGASEVFLNGSAPGVGPGVTLGLGARDRARLALGTDGAPFLAFLDPQGQVFWSAPGD